MREKNTFSVPAWELAFKQHNYVLFHFNYTMVFNFQLWFSLLIFMWFSFNFWNMYVILKQNIENVKK